MRILFVQTHADSATVICRLLRAVRHDVSIVCTLRAAWDVLETCPPDLLVFGGVEVGDGSAWDFMPRVRGQFATPAILLSGYGMEEDRRRTIAAGFAEHLVKPVASGVLLECVNRVGAARHVGNAAGATREGA